MCLSNGARLTNFEPNWTKLVHFGLKRTIWPKLDHYCQLAHIGQNWTPMNHIEEEKKATMIHLVLLYTLLFFEPNWTKMDQIGPNWTKLDQIGPNWTKLDQIGPH